MRRSAVVTLFALATVAIGCSPRGDDSANGGLVNTSWTVISIDGQPAQPDARPTLTFAQDGTVSGSAGCNQYSGPFRTDGDLIKIGPVQSTLMGCAGERGQQEVVFLKGLDGAATWRQNEAGQLEIGGVIPIVAGPGVAEGPPGDAPRADLPGTTWTLADMGGTADFARLVPTLELGADGTVSGFAGCNTFTGTYTVSGGDLTLGPLAATKIGCPRPASAVETAYLDALAGATTWSIGADSRLTLGGAVPLIFDPS